MDTRRPGIPPPPPPPSAARPRQRPPVRPRGAWPAWATNGAACIDSRARARAPVVYCCHFATPLPPARARPDCSPARPVPTVAPAPARPGVRAPGDSVDNVAAGYALTLTRGGVSYGATPANRPATQPRRKEIDR